jgi:hypothetical protein
VNHFPAASDFPQVRIDAMVLRLELRIGIFRRKLLNACKIGLPKRRHPPRAPPDHADISDAMGKPLANYLYIFLFARFCIVDAVKISNSPAKRGLPRKWFSRRLHTKSQLEKKI